ncbi:MAG: diguanylate cyclase domain-containing protein [Bacillota bacterium]
MPLAGFRADRLQQVTILQSLVLGAGAILNGESPWPYPALLLAGAALLLLALARNMTRLLRLGATLLAGAGLIAYGLSLLPQVCTATGSMAVLGGLGLFLTPLVTVEPSDPAYASAEELSKPLFGLVLLGSAAALLIRQEPLPLMQGWERGLLLLGIGGGLLFLADTFIRLRLDWLNRAVGLAFTLPMASVALAYGNGPIALSWVIWAGAILVGDLRDLAEWRKANDRLLRQQEELRRLNSALSESEERFRIAFQNAPIGMALVDAGGRILEVNPALCQMLGYSAAELTRMDLMAVTHPEDVAADLAQLHRVFEGRMDGYRMEKRYIHKDGRIIWGELRAAVVRDSRGRLRYVLGQVQDVTEQKLHEEQLREMADRDPLTGLHNRRRFQEELHWALALWQRYGTPGAVVVMDLDGFKAINDTLGHHTGDELLRRIGAALLREMRETDLYARLGGDEFACFLAAVTPEEAVAVTQRVQQAVERTCLAADIGPFHVTVSAGIAMLPEHGSYLDDLLIRADMAMYQAKREGKNRICLFGPNAEAVFPPRAGIEP